MAPKRAQNIRRAAPENRRRKRKPTRKEGAGPLLLVVFGLAFLVALFSWGFSLEDASDAAAVLLLSESARLGPDLADEGPLFGADVIEGVIGRGETLSQSLKARGVARERAREITDAMRDAFDFRVTHAGDGYTLKLSPKTQEIVWFEYRGGPLEIYQLSRGGEGALSPFHKEDLPPGQVVAVGGLVGGSLFTSLKTLGEEGALAVSLAEIFAFDFDLYEATPRDRFWLLVEKSGGEPARYGKILAAKYERPEESFLAFWYVDPEGHASYVNEEGAYLKKSFLRSPLKFAPLEGAPPLRSAASYRVAPNLPVVAVGDGVIVSIEKEENEGFRLVVEHTGGYQTHYTKLARLAPGLREGVLVNQHRILGYTGAKAQGSEGTLGFFLERRDERLDLPSLPQRTRSIPARHRAHFEKFLQEQLAALSSVAINDVKEAAAKTTPYENF